MSRLQWKMLSPPFVSSVWQIGYFISRLRLLPYGLVCVRLPTRRNDLREARWSLLTFDVRSGRRRRRLWTSFRSDAIGICPWNDNPDFKLISIDNRVAAPVIELLRRGQPSRRSSVLESHLCHLLFVPKHFHLVEITLPHVVQSNTDCLLCSNVAVVYTLQQDTALEHLIGFLSERLPG